MISNQCCQRSVQSTSATNSYFSFCFSQHVMLVSTCMHVFLLYLHTHNMPWRRMNVFNFSFTILYTFLVSLQFSFASFEYEYIPIKLLSETEVSLHSVTFSRIARFSNVQHLSIHISKNFGEESTRVYYIGLRGEYSEVSLFLFLFPKHLKYFNNIAVYQWG